MILSLIKLRSAIVKNKWQFSVTCNDGMGEITDHVDK